MEENNKIKDYTTRILDSKYLVEFYDIEKIGKTTHGMKKDVNVYVAKASAYEESQMEDIAQRHSDLNYIGFELNGNSEQKIIEDDEFRKGLMEYVLMYYLHAKNKDRKNFKYYLGLFVWGEDGHYLTTKSPEVEKMFEEYIDKIMKEKEIDDIVNEYNSKKTQEIDDEER